MIPATDVLAEVFTEEISRQKKEQGISPAPEIVSTLFPQLFDFG
jgi:hypothetical protein